MAPSAKGNSSLNGATEEGSAPKIPAIKSENGLIIKSPAEQPDDIFGRLDRLYDDDDLYAEDDDDSPPVDDSLQPFELTLKTINADRALIGIAPTENKPGVPGIRWFLQATSTVCKHAHHGDPYALMTLFYIEALLQETHTVFHEYERMLNEKLNSGSRYGLRYVGGHKRVKYEVKKHFLAPRDGYGYAAIQLVGQFDNLIIIANQARDMNLITGQVLKKIRAPNPFYKLTNSLRKFRASHTTRQDFRAETQKARDAVHLYGPIINEVMDPSFKLTLMEIDDSFALTATDE